MRKYEFFPFAQRNQRIILASDTKKPLKRLVLRGYIQNKGIMKSIHGTTRQQSKIPKLYTGGLSCSYKYDV